MDAWVKSQAGQLSHIDNYHGKFRKKRDKREKNFAAQEFK